jgi:DNA-binding response OmpR family regulator
LIQVLYIDDDRMMRAIASAAAAKEGDIALTVADDGRTGIDMAKQQSFDIILLDLVMPGMDGVAALQQLRANPETQSMPIAFITARSTPSDVERLEKLGAVGIITKPFKIDALFNQVRELLKKTTFTHGEDVQFSHLQKEFIDRARRDSAALQAAASCLTQDHPEALQTLQHLSHRLAGSAGTFGYAALSAEAAKLEDALHEGQLDAHKIDTALKCVLREIGSIDQTC